jgi:hypothetical protein
MEATLGKIEVGECAMPDAPSAVQDLPRGLLAVDLARRLAIEDVKRERAFLSGLPAGRSRPIIASGCDWVVEAFEQIGVGSRAGIVALLSESGTNLAMIFFEMPMIGTGWRDLPWRSSHPFVDPLDDFGRSECVDG